MSDLTSLRNSLRRKTHNYETMKAIQHISDETIKTDPVTWFLQYEEVIESILRLGEGTTSQCSLEQYSAVNYHIRGRLTHTLLTQAYQLKGNPRKQLEEIANMISEARTNAEKRVTELPETKTINRTTLAKVLQVNRVPNLEFGCCHQASPSAT